MKHRGEYDGVDDEPTSMFGIDTQQAAMRPEHSGVNRRRGLGMRPADPGQRLVRDISEFQLALARRPAHVALLEFVQASGLGSMLSPSDGGGNQAAKYAGVGSVGDLAASARAL